MIPHTRAREICAQAQKGRVPAYSSAVAIRLGYVLAAVNIVYEGLVQVRGGRTIIGTPPLDIV